MARSLWRVLGKYGGDLVGVTQHLPQGLAPVLPMKEPTLLEDWDHQRHEFLNRRWRIGHRQHKAIATSVLVVGFELISHLLGGADDLGKPEALAVHLGHFTQGQLFTRHPRVHIDYPLRPR